MAFDIKMIRKVYEKYPAAVETARKATNKPLTLAEKILYTHLWKDNIKRLHDIIHLKDLSTKPDVIINSSSLIKTSDILQT